MPFQDLSPVSFHPPPNLPSAAPHLGVTNPGKRQGRPTKSLGSSEYGKHQLVWDPLKERNFHKASVYILAVLNVCKDGGL